MDKPNEKLLKDYIDKTHEKLLKDVEVAERLGVNVWTLRSWRSQRCGLPFIKVGALARYRPEDIEDYLERRTISPKRD